MLIACLRFSSPAEIKPTTRTVVIEEDWIIAVTKAPVKAPLNLLVVILENRFFRRFPAIPLRAVVICSSPNKKSAKPPNKPSKSGMILNESVVSIRILYFRKNNRLNSVFKMNYSTVNKFLEEIGFS